MEEAVQALGIRELRAYEREYDRIYVGDEFCERLLPTKNQVKKMLKFCEKEEKDFTLTTPYVTDWGLSKMKKLLKVLPEKTEVVVNDWGMLENVKAFNLTPVVGRILIKYKRDPRVYVISHKLPRGCREVLHSSALTQKRFIKFLKENGIHRIELDNTPFHVNHGNLSGFKVSLHVPYVYVTTTRQCLTHYFATGEFGIRDCAKACLKHTFTWTNPEFSHPFIQQGNTLYYINKKIKKERGVDRIIYHKTILSHNLTGNPLSP